VQNNGEMRCALVSFWELVAFSTREPALFGAFQTVVGRRVQLSEVFQIFREAEPISRSSRVACLLSIDKSLDDHSSLSDSIRTVESQDAYKHTTFLVERFDRTIRIDAETAPIADQTRVRDSKVGLQVVAPTAHVE
jgi:hypothetical protein